MKLNHEKQTPLIDTSSSVQLDEIAGDTSSPRPNVNVPTVGIWEKLRTYNSLGLPNLWRVFVYRVKKSTGHLARTMPIGEPYDGPFFKESSDTRKLAAIESQDSQLPTDDYQLSYTLFSHIEVPVDGAPDWFVNPLNGERIDAVDKHWSKTKDFSAKLGDIKCVWEASRFDWLPQAAWELRCASGEAREPNAARISPLVSRNSVNSWIADWVKNNPMNQGPNWRCGQEVSIRIMNMLLAGKILGDLESPTHSFVRFLVEHARRVPPTIEYAVGQDSNHATSEAAALFLIGHYLERYLANQSENDSAGLAKEAKSWQLLGRYWLEERVRHLITVDGTFAQYSVNYHRLMLSTTALTEAFRKEWNVDSFSNVFYERMAAATRWLYQMTDPVSGDAPNMGPNDGAYLFNLDERPYRDFRPTVAFAKAMFRVEANSTSVSALCKLFREKSSVVSRQSSTVEAKNWQLPTANCQLSSSFTRLSPTPNCWGVVRVANFDVRPKEADVLHLDLWRDGVNVLRDGGSFSYADPRQAAYFTGTVSHNTVQFDGRDQMRRMGRFLFADWVRMHESSHCDSRNDRVTWSAGYTDFAGASHQRSITASNVNWIINDSIRGFKKQAVIRWRMCPGNWQLEGTVLRSHVAQLSVRSDQEIHMRLTTGQESLHYFDRKQIPVLEIICRTAATIRTRIEW